MVKLSNHQTLEELASSFLCSENLKIKRGKFGLGLFLTKRTTGISTNSNTNTKCTSKATIPAGTVIVSVPLKSCISFGNIKLVQQVEKKVKAKIKETSKTTTSKCNAAVNFSILMDSLPNKESKLAFMLMLVMLEVTETETCLKINNNDNNDGNNDNNDNNSDDNNDDNNEISKSKSYKDFLWSVWFQTFPRYVEGSLGWKDENVISLSKSCESVSICNFHTQNKTNLDKSWKIIQHFCEGHLHLDARLDQEKKKINQHEAGNNKEEKKDSETETENETESSCHSETVFAEIDSLVNGFDLYKYCYSIILSRALSLTLNQETHLSVVPIVDMANHTQNPNTKVKFDVDKQSFQLITIQDIPSDTETEIFIKYGDKTNGELVASYGFAVNDNRDDRIGIQIPLLDLSKYKNPETSESERAAMLSFAEMKAKMLPMGLGIGAGSISDDNDNRIDNNVSDIIKDNNINISKIPKLFIEFGGSGCTTVGDNYDNEHVNNTTYAIKNITEHKDLNLLSPQDLTLIKIAALTINSTQDLMKISMLFA